MRRACFLQFLTWGSKNAQNYISMILPRDEQRHIIDPSDAALYRGLVEMQSNYVTGYFPRELKY